ncbi:MAG: hypothetical protein JW913_20460 [Chitinispirillaceae bacterium]|nr:hypothetical protein [Chitinispirillaceae bacterium]
MNRSKRLMTAILLTLVASLRAQVTVVENTPQQLTFSWDLNGIDTSLFFDGEKPVTSLSFTGSDISIGGEGEFVLPGYALVMGVPPEGEISAVLTPLTTKTIPLAHPPATWKGRSGVPRKSTIVFSNRWIAHPEYSIFRSQRTARLVIRPVQYDATTRAIVYLAKGTCTIRFPQTPYRSRSMKTGGDFELMLRRLLVNYDAARGWRAATPLAKKTVSPYPLPPDQKMFMFRIGDGHEGLNEATIRENGIVKITGKRIRELFGAVPPARVKLYAAFKGMLPDTLPDDGSILDGVNEVPLLRLDRNGNNVLDDDDCLLAYVTGASDWMADTQWGTYRFDLDLYDDYRTYWLTVSSGDGLSIGKERGEPSPATREVTAFTDLLQYRRSALRREGNPGNRKWIWRVLSNSQRSFQQRFDLPGLVTGDTGWLQVGCDSRGGGYTLTFGTEELCTECAVGETFPITSWGDSTARFEFAGEGNETNGRIEISHLTISYQRALEIGDSPSVLSIMPPPADSDLVCAYNLDIRTSQKIYIFRVPDDERGIVLIDTVTRSGNGTYQWIDTACSERRYVLCNEAALKPLPEVSEPVGQASGGSVVVRDLRATNNRTGFLIITHPDFLAAAESLARHKAEIGFARPSVVDINDIYRFFSGGDKDVAAIRNFIGYVARYWKDGGALDYVLLVGVGHFDAKNVFYPAPDFIPAYIHGDENSEDFLTRIAPLIKEPQLAVGRLPCTTVEQAWAMVKKIVDTEDPGKADFSEWRNRALFVADDDMQGDKYDQVASSTPHHLSSDRTVAVVDSLWPSIDVRKVYLYEYEWDQAHQKPSASRALINEINNGVGYINFFGHGADITWTDEYILTAEMVAGMSNAKRYPVISAFSCSVGRFDVPGSECLSGVLARSPEIGSIASISSTREAYANANENLAKSFYRYLFDTTGSPLSIGLALIAGQVNSSGDGHRTYCILGDPSVRAVRPTHRIRLALDDKDDTLAALQKVTVSGTVINGDGNVDDSFGGEGAYVSLGLFNAPDTASRKDGGEHKEVRYVLPGAPMFLGKTAIVNGTFKQTVLVPQNLSFDKPGVKLTAYAWKEHSTMAGTGYRRDLIFHGSIPLGSGGVTDTTGPRITIRPAYDNEQLLSGKGASFTDRVTTQMPVKCEIELFDESGIDAAGIGPDEGVTLEIEGVFARQNVNNKFQFKEGDFRQGIVSVVYEEEALKPGTYTMAVTARDLVGNLSKARFSLIVTAWDELKLDHVLNFPNPVRLGKETRFYCHSNYTSQQYYGADVRLTIKIYTLGGRLLYVDKDFYNGKQWKCRDQAGNLLSPDVYLYRITAEDYSLRKTVKSRIMKLVILPPR